MFLKKKALLILVLISTILFLIGCSNGTDGDYTLTINEIGNGRVSIDPASQSYVENQKVTLNAIPDADWRFAYWEGSGINNTIPELDLVMTDDISLQATFGQISRESYFENNKNPGDFWFIDSYDYVTYEIKNEKYSITIHQDDIQQGIIAPYNSDFFIELDVQFITDNHGVYGTWFNFDSNSNNHYLFKISSNGHYSIGRMIDGNMEYIDEWLESDLINISEGVKNNIAIRKNNDVYTIYVNGQYLNEVKVNQVSEPEFGLFVWADVSPVEVAFDNIIELAL
ncbi:InlB B-repeat-containing protein [Natronospora cellulosivora (SeqCode)]